MASKKLAVTYRPVDSLKPYAKNARTHSEAQVGQIAASITEFGFTQPILVDGKSGVVAGHGRLLAAKSLGMAQVPVIELSGLTAAQKRAYVIADNKLTLNGGWDDSLLAEELKALGEAGFDLKLTGFDDVELVSFLSSGEGKTDPDDVPDPPPVPVTRLGDVWLCGDHRVICGDSRNADDIDMLVGEDEINVAFTSPPYAEQREYDASSGFKPIHPDQYVDWFKPVAANVAAHLAQDGSWFVNIKPSADGLDTFLYVMDLVIAHVREWEWHFATEFCWERNGVPKSVTQRFKNQFEPVYQFARNRWKMRPDAVRHESANVPRAGGKGSGDTSWAKTQGGNGPMFGSAKKRRKGTSEFMSGVQGAAADVGEYIGPGLAYPGNRLPTFTESHSATGHTAAFPVGLPEFFINAFTDPGDVVFDPFCGSGSTLIAAEKTGRSALGCEISAEYCDVIVTRWQAFTGREATLMGTDTTFAEIARQRAQKAA